MVFYGTQDALLSWGDLLMSVLDADCKQIVSVDNRLQFEVELSADDLAHLQENYWYAVEEGQDMPWNWRIAHSNS